MYEENYGAEFSSNRKHRYMLWRTWNLEISQRAVFVGLNPSQADEETDDPTLRRCQSFARSWTGKWRCGGLFVVNLYSFCSPSPAELFRVAAPVSKKAEQRLEHLCSQPDSLVIGMWGNHGLRNDRCHQFTAWAKANDITIHCLTVNTSGTPAHPLYLKKGLKPKVYKASFDKVLKKKAFKKTAGQQRSPIHHISSYG